MDWRLSVPMKLMKRTGGNQKHEFDKKNWRSAVKDWRTSEARG
jgi:hypothetical protein